MTKAGEQVMWVFTMLIFVFLNQTICCDHSLSHFVEAFPMNGHTIGLCEEMTKSL